MLETTTQERSLNPARAFWRYIWDDPCVCNGCFTRVQTSWAHRELMLGGKLDTPVRHYRTEDASLGIDKVEHDEYGELYTSPARTTCEACGSVGCREESRDLSRREAVELVEALAERCREAGIPVHEPLMKRIVGLAKSNEAINADLDIRDRHIFAKAVEGSIRHSQ